MRPYRPPTRKATLARLSRSAHDGLITVDGAATALRVPRRTAAVRLASLARSGWLARVRRGVYYTLPLEAASAEVAVPDDPWMVATVLFPPCYIGGWSAAEHWGLTEQIFRSTFVVTAAAIRRTEQSFLGLDFHLTHVTEHRLADTTRVWRGRERVAVSGRERTIVDALNTPAWLGGVRHLADVMGRYTETAAFSFSALLTTLNRHGTAAAHKRFAYLVEALWPDSPEAHAAGAHALARRSAGVIKLDPSVRARGTLRRRWGLYVNVNL